MRFQASNFANKPSSRVSEFSGKYSASSFQCDLKLEEWALKCRKEKYTQRQTEKATRGLKSG